MRTLTDFLSAMEREAGIDDAERGRLSRIWPAADAAAQRIAATLPAPPWWSRKRRRALFLDVCGQLDGLQDRGALSDEQAQLVLTLLRARHAGYRLCEATFLISPAAAGTDSLTARQLLLAVRFDRSGQR